MCHNGMFQWLILGLAWVVGMGAGPKVVELDGVAGTEDVGGKGGAYGTMRIGCMDAYVKEWALKYPGNWGWMDMCRVGGRGEDVNRALVWFDLSQVAKDASIRQATLRLTLTPYTNQAVESGRLGAYLLKLPDEPGWKGEEVDSVNRKAGVAWGAGGVVGASGGKPVAVGKVITRQAGGRRIPEAMEFDLTGVVRAWVGGKVRNCGIVLDGRLEGGGYDFYSSRADEVGKRPVLEMTLSPAVEREQKAMARPATVPQGDYWVEPMRRVHARFTGNKGRCALYGDSISYSMAFLGTAAWGKEIAYKNVGAEAKADLEAVWGYADRGFWQKRDPSLGQQGQMKSDWFLANVDGWQKRMRPEACVILFGSNDLGRVYPPEYTENMAAGIGRILADGTVPMLTTVPPASGRGAMMNDYYVACGVIARHFQIPVIDYYGEIMRRRPGDWDGTLERHKEKAKDAQGRVDVYAVLAPISADGVHPSNPKKYQGDFSEEALNNNGFVLRDYMTLRMYGQVIREVFNSN